jgi:hypothetical protein
MLSYENLSYIHQLLWQLSQKYPEESEKLQELIGKIGEALSNEYYNERIFALEQTVPIIGYQSLWEIQKLGEEVNDFVADAAQKSLERATRIRKTGSSYFWQFRDGKLVCWNHNNETIMKIALETRLFHITPDEMPQEMQIGKEVESISNLTTGVKIGDKGQIIQSRCRPKSDGGIDHLIFWNSRTIQEDLRWINHSHLKID